MADRDDEVKGKAIGGKARAAKLSPERKAEIAKKAAFSRWQNPRSNNTNQVNVVVPPSPPKPRSSAQGVLDLQIEKQIEVDGIGMGVLSDGTAFLNGRGLARLCGIDSSRISEMASDWRKSTLPLTSKVKTILQTRGLTLDHPYIEIKQRSGYFHAYPDFLCLAVLEYYAFDAPTTRDEAQKNYRLLAGKALHDFIYTQVGYDPNNFVPEVWRQFHDRVSLTYNSVPAGYFGVFKEIADMIVTLGQAGMQIDSSFVPDISVGMGWAKHWTKENLEIKYGERVKWDHNYPEYFAQALSNPQETWCYPEMALGEFRKWLRENYIQGGKFANYINTKIQQKALPASFAQLVITAYNLKDDGSVN